MNTRIDALLASAGRPTLSYEFFPPKSEEATAQLMTVAARLKSLGPDFISITRTGGGAPPTIELTAKLQEELGIPAMTHLTCAGYTSAEIAGLLQDAWNLGIRNILALRGDAAPGAASFSVTEGGFGNASDLVSFAAGRHPFSLGVAGYPEGHPQALNLTRDAEYLKLKQDNGAHFVITQLFFDNEDFLRWRDRVRGLGVTVPLIAGILPIGNVAQIKRFVTVCGAKIPHELLVRIEALEHDGPAVEAAGRDHAVEQCAQLISEGVDGLHFYTLNRSEATGHIVSRLKESNVI